jgi:hypothetical protein
VTEAKYANMGLPYSFLDLPGCVVNPFNLSLYGNVQDAYAKAPWTWVNHSRLLPNLQPRLVTGPEGKTMVLETKYLIPAGFELRWDYDRYTTRRANRPAWMFTS